VKYLIIKDNVAKYTTKLSFSEVLEKAMNVKG
jgi:hypothetical protein